MIVPKQHWLVLNYLIIIDILYKKHNKRLEADTVFILQVFYYVSCKVYQYKRIFLNFNEFKLIWNIVFYVVGPPQTPTNFTLVSSTDTSIVIEWIPGYNGGHEQIFIIQYRIINESNIWITQKIPKYDRQTYTLVDLQGDTWYELRMFAGNKFDRSLVTYIQSISTMPAVDKGIFF